MHCVLNTFLLPFRFSITLSATEDNTLSATEDESVFLNCGIQQHRIALRQCAQLRNELVFSFIQGVEKLRKKNHLKQYIF